jgi:hypothetical protein
VILPRILNENLLVEPADTANYRETDEQWFASLLDQRQELSIQLARLDVEIEIVRKTLRARETAKTRGVPEDRES